MNTITKADILELSVPERILLVEDIWDSIVNFPDSIKLTDEQKKELEARLNSYHKNPNLGSPWKDVKKRILNEK